MSNRQFQINYDELTAIAKKFHDEGEDFAQIYATTRQRVRDLYKDWIGEGADKFFDEMETEVLPALDRLSRSLLFSHDVTQRIMRLIHDADEETAGYFRHGLETLTGGLGLGALAASMIGQFNTSGAGDDFGAGEFGNALGGISGSGTPSPDDFGAKEFEGAVPNQENTTSGAQQQQSGGGEQPKTPTQTPQTQMGGSGGSGGSGGASQGLQGDLKGLGSNLGGTPEQNATVGGSSTTAGGQSMPDHIYANTPDSSGAGEQTQSGGTGGSEQSSGGSSGATGAAGAAGAAAGAGGVAKALKNKKKKDG